MRCQGFMNGGRGVSFHLQPGFFVFMSEKLLLAQIQ